MNHFICILFGPPISIALKRYGHGVLLSGCLLMSTWVSAQPIGVVQAPLSASRDAVWPLTIIRVCWENPTRINAWHRNHTRQAITNTWQRESALQFVGWGACQTNEDIRIRIADENPRTIRLGRHLQNVRGGMVLNFTFRNWCPRCRIDSVNSIRSIAIHEFGHALGMTHEHNRADCQFCNDAPQQGTIGDWNVTDCDPNSIMNYCFGSSYNGQLSGMDIQGVRALYGLGSTLPPAGTTQLTFRPATLKGLCPKNKVAGDREFGGGVPITCSVQLLLSADRRRLDAEIYFHAREAGADHSEVRELFRRTLYTAEPGVTIDRIETDTYSETNFISITAGSEFIGCNNGTVEYPRVINGQLVRLFGIIGDTGGDDISSDDDCGCDTQIQRIEFNSVRLTLRRGLTMMNAQRRF